MHRRRSKETEKTRVNSLRKTTQNAIKSCKVQVREEDRNGDRKEKKKTTPSNMRIQQTNRRTDGQTQKRERKVKTERGVKTA